jgi:hypothetical protein
VAQSTLSRLERGHLDTLALGTLRRIFAVVDARVDLDPRWRGGELDRLLDADHAAIVTTAAAWVEQFAWVAVPEVTYSVFGERGSIDLVALRQQDSLAVMLEVKTSINSVEELLRKTDAKTRLLPGLILDRFGWRPASVVRILVVADSRTNRRRIAAMGPLLASSFPGSTVDTKRWLRSPDRSTPGVWFLSASDARDVGHRASGRERVRVRPAASVLAAESPGASVTRSGGPGGSPTRRRLPKNPAIDI